ncbi:MAG: DUF4136 domain-containing protein [Syntrophales bacterium LBB04]|nr:DUF4136 domain-containing protein [Syntrophales bacterium LBB04]
MKALHYSIILALILFSLNACGPARIAMKVESFNNPDVELSNYKRFALLNIQNEKQLLEKELQSSIKKAMEQKGFFYDEKNPDFLIAVNFGVEARTEQHKVSSRPVQVYQPEYGKVGTWQTQHVTSGGGSSVVETKWMKIDFIDNKNRTNSERPDFIWQGEVKSDTKREFTHISDCLIMGLMEDFPMSKNKTTLKKIPYSSCEK